MLNLRINMDRRRKSVKRFCKVYLSRVIQNLLNKFHLIEVPNFLNTTIVLSLLISNISVASAPVRAQNTLNVGTSQTYTTIQSAISAAGNGDLIVISMGTYVENLLIDKVVTIQCANAGISAGSSPGTRNPETIIQGEATVSAIGVVIDGCHFIRPAGLNQYSNVPKLISSNVAGEITVRNSKLDMTFPGSVSVDLPNGSSACGSGTSGTAEWRIYNNEFKNIRYSTSGASACAAALRYGSRAIFADSGRKIVVEGNRFYNTGQGVFITGPAASGSEIRGNLFTSLGTAGVFLGTPQNVVISGNTFEGYGGVYLDKSVGTIIENNIFSVTNWFALNADSTHEGTIFRNNAVLGKYPSGYSTYTGKTLFNTSLNSINASNNWWGSTAEPTISALLSSSAGGVVTYAPWISSYTIDPSKDGRPGFWPINVGSSIKLPQSAAPQNIELINVEGAPLLTLPASTSPISISTSAIASSSLPGNYIPFQLDGATLIDIDISGTFDSGSEFIICLNGFAPQKLWHFKGEKWNNVTRNDIFAAGKICGSVTSFSPFAVGITKQALVFIPIPSIAPSIQTINAKAGAEISPTSTFFASNFGGTVSYQISPTLPSGLKIDSATGVISGTPSTGQLATTHIVTATGSSGGIATSSITIAIAENLLPMRQSIEVVAGVPVQSKPLTTIGFLGAIQYTITPTLPIGLQLNNSTGIISGSPTLAQKSRLYTINAVGENFGSASSEVSISISPKITPVIEGIVADAGLEINASATFVTIGLVPGVTYSISPALPDGLSINSLTGVVSGLPTIAQTSRNYTISAIGKGFNDDNFTITSTISIAINARLIVDSAFVGKVTRLIQGRTTKAVGSYTAVGFKGVTRYSISPSLPSGLLINPTNGKIRGKPKVGMLPTTFTITAIGSKAGRASAQLVLEVIPIPK